jgi:glycosyltransferase involved in cell wall biosynthesis
VVTVHDIAPLLFPGRRWGLSSLAWRLAWRGAQKASWWITVSEFTRCEVLAKTSRSQERVITIWEGVDDHFRPISERMVKEFRKNWGFDSKKAVLHVGHCRPRKNVEGLLHALALLRQRGMDVLLIQVGGSFSPIQRQIVHSLRLEQSACQWKYVPEDDLVTLYNVADVFVLPSFYEGFGLPVLEAMACGTPVVAANVASLPEVVGDAGLLVNPRDPEAIAEAIARVLDDRALAADLQARGLERARQFTWERTARETLKVYQRVSEDKL